MSDASGASEIVGGDQVAAQLMRRVGELRAALRAAITMARHGYREDVYGSREDFAARLDELEKLLG